MLTNNNSKAVDCGQTTSVDPVVALSNKSIELANFEGFIQTDRPLIGKTVAKKRYECSNCGQVTNKWIGQCNICKEWNSIIEVDLTHNSGVSTINSPGYRAQKLSHISMEDSSTRIKTGFSAYDELMGGGLMPGSVNLLGGEPGSGKSTFTLQLAGGMAHAGLKVLMVSAEESIMQVKSRACRLGVVSENLWITPETDIEKIITEVQDLSPDVVIVDSIQTVGHCQISSFPGSPPQVRAVTFEIINLARLTGLTVLIVGQVTKDGYLAGPKVLEHMVDSVVMFNGDRASMLRTLVVIKNRFGSCDEIAVLEMTSKGLNLAKDLNRYFVESDLYSQMVGTCFVPTVEMQQVHISEIQTLVSKFSGQNPRRVAEGIDSGRLLILVATLEKYCNIKFSDRDIFLSVSKNNKMADKVADLSICTALLSSFLNKPIPRGTAFLGEVSLNGNIKPITMAKKRLNELHKLHFETVLGNFSENDFKLYKNQIGMIKVDRITDLNKAFMGL